MVFKPSTSGRCPHCGITVLFLNSDAEPFENYNRPRGLVMQRGEVTLSSSMCPNCMKAIVEIKTIEGSWLVWPRNTARKAIHPSVPQDVAGDFREAALLAGISPKASAALSRRCLQLLLVKNGATKRELVEQLVELRPTFPSYIQAFVDHVRQLGNIAAHPKESKTTGEIVDIETGEAEWMLEILEELFDHYYAKPAEALAKQTALLAKISDSGKVQP